MKVGFAVCGSFCTFAKAFSAMEAIAQQHTVVPIFSFNSASIDSRFGTAAAHLRTAEEICQCPPLVNIPQVEPIGPKRMLDALVIAPCTGNTLAKLAHGIADTPVTMAAKSHLRNGRPVLIAVSTNDGLAAAAENIGKLMARQHIYFVPFSQDDPINKPASLVALFDKIPEALDAALHGRQLQPVIA